MPRAEDLRDCLNDHRCPACDHSNEDSRLDANGVCTCARCGAIFSTRTIYLGTFHGYVKPFWATSDVPPDQCVYFDFDTLGSAGLQRHHGWMDRVTKRIVQTG